MKDEEKQAIAFGEWLLSIGIILDKPVKYRTFYGRDVDSVKDLYKIYIEYKR